MRWSSPPQHGPRAVLSLDGEQVVSSVETLGGQATVEVEIWVGEWIGKEIEIVGQAGMGAKVLEGVVVVEEEEGKEGGSKISRRFCAL